jgi:hypothetical protein
LKSLLVIWTESMVRVGVRVRDMDWDTVRAVVGLRCLDAIYSVMNW